MKPLGTLCLILLAVPAWGQQPKPLTLAAALELASRQNLELAAARERRGVTQAGVQIARQRPNPTSSFSLQRDPPHEGVLFDQPLEIGGRRGRRIELARQEGGLTEVEIGTLGQQVRRRVREAFYGVALARGLTRQRGQALELAKRVREIAQARFAVGDIPQLDVFQAEMEVARAEADYGVARQRERVALSDLNVLLGEPPETLWEPASPLEDLPARIALSELARRAEESSPALQHLAQEQKVEQSRRALLEAERIPNLEVQFGADFNSPNEFRVGPRGQLSMVLPLFARNQGEIARSAASLRVLAGETAATRRAVTGRVEAAYYDLSARQDQAETYRRNLVPAVQRLEGLAEESYRAGKSGILTVLDAQRNVQEIERGYLEILFEVQAAFARLEEIVGARLD